MIRFVLILTLICAALTAHARPVTSQDKAAIAGLAKTIESRFMNRQYMKLMGGMPPTMARYLSKRHGYPAMAIKGFLAKDMRKQMKPVTPVSYDLQPENATYHATSARPYGRVPTVLVADIAGQGRVTSKSQMLALWDEGAWYIIRVDTARNREALRGAYPDFKGVKFSDAQITK